jgi:myosin heavy subunit
MATTEGNRGWVSFRDGLWEECTVVEAEEKQLKLKLKDGTSKTFKRADIGFHYRNPSAVEDLDDFLNLPNLDEPNILHSVRVRYWKHHVYSYTGPILIAVNPWRRVNIYEQSVLNHYTNTSEELPHIFGIAAKVPLNLNPTPANTLNPEP